MALSRIAILALALLQWAPSVAYPTGAPEGACESMAPKHKNVSPQTSASPYSITASNSLFKADQKVQVTITGEPYQGLLLQAREMSKSTAVGTWEAPPNNTKPIKCFNVMNSSITHSNTYLETNETVYTWIPPSSNKCIKIQFVATVAKNKATYWLNVRSPQLYDETCSSCVKIIPGFTLLLFTMMWSIISQ
uniref:Reelin domain-containing protein n=1 Tax=Callorhinchus milii TaxID=7868 RepID=K4G3I8_CALMI|nr:hypothetical protein [Callorhinchus milii]